MRKLVVPLVLLVLAVTTAFAAPLHWLDRVAGSRLTGEQYPLPTALAPTNGYGTVATPTLSVATDTAASIGTLPANTHIVEIYAYNGDVNYGGAGVASGTTDVGIASGSKIEIPVATTTPAIYLIGRSGSCNARIRAR